MDSQEQCFSVNTQSLEESNLFLRKLYELLSDNGKLGWLCQPYKEKDRTKIHIGHTNIGEICIDYKEKGKIKNIYFSLAQDDLETQNRVSKCITEAKKTFKTSLIKYIVKIGFVDYAYIPGIDDNYKKEELRSKKEAYNNILCTYNEDNKTIEFTFSVEAFGDFDIEYVITQKANYLKILLSVYSNSIYKIKTKDYKQGEFQCTDIALDKYNINWIETSDTYISPTTIVFSPELFAFFNKVLSNTHENKNLRLILNSAQQLYCAHLMKRDAFVDPNHMIPGYIDLINTTLVSALEPISNINAPEPETCKKCGQLKYSIRKKVKKLCSNYVPNLNEYIGDTLYAERSAFLHEGNAKTNEFYCGHCMPLLNPNDGKSIMNPVVTINHNMYEYVSYIIRKVITENI